MNKRGRTVAVFSLALGFIPALLLFMGVANMPVGFASASIIIGASVGFAFIAYEAKKSERDYAAELKAAADQIHDLKGKINELAETDVRYKELMNETKDAVILVDEAGEIIEANSAFAGVMKSSELELSGCFLSELSSNIEKKRFKEFLSRTFSEGEATVDDIMLGNNGEGSFSFDGRAHSFNAGGQTVAQVFLEDVSERKRQFILTEKEISFFHELSRTLPLLQDFDDMLDRILSMLSETLPFHAFTLILAEPDDTRATICVSARTDQAFVDDIRECVTDVVSELGDNIDPDEVEFQIEEKANLEATSKQTVGSQILLPLSIVNGFAGLFSSESTAFKKEDLSLFSTMVSGISSLYIAYKSYQKVQQLSITDSLTGLFNRRKFFEELDREVKRVSRYESPMSLIMLDIDHFKGINDQYGHQMGDEVLRLLSEILVESTRKTDIVARYGGEEFIIILTETPLVGALDVANRIRLKVETASVLGAGIEIRFTVSLGLTDHYPNDTVDIIVGRADQALYAAKENGRNRVEQCGVQLGDGQIC